MKTLLITGGAGFIGVNSARHFAAKGWKVVVLDNLSRRGTEGNLKWLQEQAPIEFERADIRDGAAVASIVQRVQPDVVLHLAAQVAVTTSVTDPREDFEINALGTFNMLEAVRQHSPQSFFITASTNKVYGKMHDVAVVERGGRYEYRDLATGANEEQQLDFHSPYGCSKGTADQYTIDYSRIYGLKTVAFRQSCIYGTRQFGIEDQGWVAWFTIAAVLGKTITIYGDGKQIRDVLHVSDLVNAYEAAIEHRDAVSGQAFNIGGGPANTLSLLELLSQLESQLGIKIPLRWDDWRPGDQHVFVCDVSKAQAMMGWEPKTSPQAGVSALIGWV
ncbi:MAG: SDR family NAD(P)-dependent oxidoreductase, partial [Ramlibacter sp.]|nr:SDR family NAD(P)-dependent oxidoreductase [Ramlibacter sp.]